jgi:hypothetical protein
VPSGAQHERRLGPGEREISLAAPDVHDGKRKAGEAAEAAVAVESLCVAQHVVQPGEGPAGVRAGWGTGRLAQKGPQRVLDLGRAGRRRQPLARHVAGDHGNRPSGSANTS